MTDLPRPYRRRPSTVLLNVLNSPELVEDVLDAIHAHGWRIVLARAARFDHPAIAMVDGKITARQLIEAAAVFDEISGDERYSAAEFIAWLLPEIGGAAERAWVKGWAA